MISLSKANSCTSFWTPFKTVRLERSHYADFVLSAPPRDKIVIAWLSSSV